MSREGGGPPPLRPEDWALLRQAYDALYATAARLYLRGIHGGRSGLCWCSDKTTATNGVPVHGPICNEAHYAYYRLGARLYPNTHYREVTP